MRCWIGRLKYREEAGLTKLAPKQARFVEEYLIDLNATQAAIRAGYSEKTAGQVGHENLKKPEIQAAISKTATARSARTGIEMDRVVRELGSLAFSDMRDFATWGLGGVTLKASEELSDSAASSILEVSETKTKDGGSTVRFKLHPKMPALDALVKHLDREDLAERLRAIEERLGLT